MDKEKIENYNLMIKHFTEYTEKINEMDNESIVEFLKSVIRWEEQTHNNNVNEIWYKLQDISNLVRKEILKRMK
jgi:hypothetical protein